MINASHSAPAIAGPAPTAEQREKERALVAWFVGRGSVVVGFSGGVDSAYLACVAVDAVGATNMRAVIGRSASYPAAQWVRAREVADAFSIPVLEIDTDELADPRYAANPSDRCYFCKNELWSRLTPLRDELGFAVVVDGTNADDLTGHRPGARAARERGVESPLAALGFTKEDIRALSHARGIPTWDQPSSPCLASRLPTGTSVTPERLRTVERAEAALRALGVTGNLRVRHFGTSARVELDPAELARWSEPAAREELARAVVGAGYERVELDPRGFRSGSLSVLTSAPGAA